MLLVEPLIHLLFLTGLSCTLLIKQTTPETETCGSGRHLMRGRRKEEEEVIIRLVD